MITSMQVKAKSLQISFHPLLEISDLCVLGTVTESNPLIKSCFHPFLQLNGQRALKQRISSLGSALQKSATQRHKIGGCDGLVE